LNLFWGGGGVSLSLQHFASLPLCLYKSPFSQRVHPSMRSLLFLLPGEPPCKEFSDLDHFPSLWAYPFPPVIGYNCLLVALCIVQENVSFSFGFPYYGSPRDACSLFLRLLLVSNPLRPPPFFYRLLRLVLSFLSTDILRSLPLSNRDEHEPSLPLIVILFLCETLTVSCKILLSRTPSPSFRGQKSQPRCI